MGVHRTSHREVVAILDVLGLTLGGELLHLGHEALEHRWVRRGDVLGEEPLDEVPVSVRVRVRLAAPCVIGRIELELKVIARQRPLSHLIGVGVRLAGLGRDRPRLDALLIALGVVLVEVRLPPERVRLVGLLLPLVDEGA